MAFPRSNRPTRRPGGGPTSTSGRVSLTDTWGRLQDSNRDGRVNRVRTADLEQCTDRSRKVQMLNVHPTHWLSRVEQVHQAGRAGPPSRGADWRVQRNEPTAERRNTSS